MRKKQQKEEIRTHTLIISDLHLGSPVSQSKKLIEFLSKVHFRKLILLGDVFESLNFEKLRESDWQFLAMIGKMSKTKKIFWVKGNHDEDLIKIFSVFTGIKIYSAYGWEYNNKKYLAIHGHQFDYFLIKNAFLSFGANLIYRFIQQIDFEDKRISRFIKSKSKGWLRVSDKVAQKAIKYAEKKKVNYIFCGHTHRAEKKRRGNIYYFNAGCWTDHPASYLSVNEDKIEIGYF